jgi:hypothetical protein
MENRKQNRGYGGRKVAEGPFTLMWGDFISSGIKEGSLFFHLSFLPSQKKKEGIIVYLRCANVARPRIRAVLVGEAFRMLVAKL